MGLKDRFKKRIKKELHFQKLGYIEAGRRLKKKLKESIAEAKENQRRQNELKQKLRTAEKEGMEFAMLEAARKIGKEKAEAQARAILGQKEGFTIRMPNLWGDLKHGKREQKKNNHS